MADNVRLSAGTADGATVATDDDGTAQHQYVKLEFGPDNTQTKVADASPLPVKVSDGTDVLLVNADGSINVASHAVTNAGTFAVQASLSAAVPAGTNNIGDVDVLSVPADPFGANADAASATGSISAKLRFIAGTGIPITGTVTVGSHAVTNAGTFAVQVDGNALTALQKIDDPVLVDDAGFTPATSSVMMAGFEADETATDSVDEGDAGAARMTLDRKQIVTAQPHTAGGLSIANMTSQDTFTALTNTAQVIKASAGMLYGWYVYNPNSSAVYVNLYNVAAASVTVGTTTPAFPIVVPATSAANILGAVGIEFTNAGWSASATTTGGGSTAPATAVEATFFYK